MSSSDESDSHSEYQDESHDLDSNLTRGVESTSDLDFIFERAKQARSQELEMNHLRRVESKAVLRHVKEMRVNSLIKQTGMLGLPREIIRRIMEYICDDHEPEGVHVLPLVATELVNIALSCPDFLAALPHSYNYLASNLSGVQSLPAEHDWNQLIRDPVSFKVSELKVALQALNLPANGLKCGI